MSNVSFGRSGSGAKSSKGKRMKNNKTSKAADGFQNFRENGSKTSAVLTGSFDDDSSSIDMTPTSEFSSGTNSGAFNNNAAAAVEDGCVPAVAFGFNASEAVEFLNKRWKDAVKNPSMEVFASSPHLSPVQTFDLLKELQNIIKLAKKQQCDPIFEEDCANDEEEIALIDE